MPTVLSKLKDSIYGREWSFPYNCYEVGHGWTPYCTGAAVDVGAATFKNALPLYTSLYLFTQLGLQRKYTPEAFLETFKSVLTSTSFISFNVLSGMSISCMLRNNSDRYYYRIQCFLPGFIASYMALLIERPSRRPALAFYLANMSSELLFKYVVSEGYIRPLPHGETVLFALGMACWLHFVRVHGFGHDPVSTALKYLIGPHEAKSRARTKIVHQSSDHEQLEDNDGQKLMLKSETGSEEQMKSSEKACPKKKSALAVVDEAINQFLNQFFGCYHVCPHKGTSCVNYTLSPMVTRFFFGYLGRSLMNLASNPIAILRSPREAITKSFKSPNTLYFGLFLSTLVGTSKAMHCILRRCSGKQEVWHSAVAGGVSGFSMLFAPRPTLSTYVIWKCLEQYFFLAVQKGNIVRVNEVIGLVYAFSVNVLLYMFAIEPSFIRPSYMKFIDKLSDHRLHQVNRMVLDVFGPHASVGYEEWFPNLDPQFMTREFQELIFNWLIQPH